MKKIFRLFIWMLLMPIILVAQIVTAQVSIIPQPQSLKINNGFFTIDKQTCITFNDQDPQLKQLATYFANYVKSISEVNLPLNQKRAKAIQLILTGKKEANPEAYELIVLPSAIKIIANTKAGIFYAFQSLIQTLPAIRTNETLSIPCLEIMDFPQFKWRGFMLDVSRHFYSVDAIKEILDLLALYKMNVFHWHLTDNEGWRLEIKKYPRLTSVGAFRTEFPGNIFYKKDTSASTGTPYRYGGYYTQEQAKEIVAYAASKNIEVIPEIEMPGHSGAALAAYPQFSCSRTAQAVLGASLWSGKINPADMNVNYCAGNDSSFYFLQDVLKEVMAIFPSAYIHIGGDEVDKSYWKKCPRCQQRMHIEGLKNEEEMQGYFLRRMQKFLLEQDKKLMGWDEILEDELLPSATVMSWRGEQGGIRAVKQNYQAIMSPGNPLYLNRYQTENKEEPLAAKASINTLEKVYQYNPLPKELTEVQKKLIIGGQAALWTEFISSVSHLEYMLLPRLPAIAEALWTPVEKKNFDGFAERLNGWHFNAWQQKGFRFHSAYFTSQSHEGNRN